jgi:hypothetical protein
MDLRPLRIYSEKDSPRLTYIAGLILGDILGLQWEVITDKRKLRKHLIINYSDDDIDGSFRIRPQTLLAETGVQNKDISVTKWKGLPVFFTSSGEADFPFDVFAAAFYLVSRYEEYLPHEPDEHGRFRASSSLSFKNGFLDLPVIDLWSKELARALVRKFHSLTFRQNKFKSILTIDIDEPFAYLGKNMLRSIGGIVNDLTAGHRNISERYMTVTRGKRDPYDVTDYIGELVRKNNQETRFFFPVGDRSKFDHNPSWKNNEYRKLISGISIQYSTGLHPSYASAVRPGMIKSEAGRLNAIQGKEIDRSRFHYIRMFMPDSYRNILDAGITEDYSMGYPDEPGFRAGIARPYFFYDLKDEKRKPLKIFPFQVMDATLFQYKKLDPETAWEIILKLMNETMRAGGTFVSIWHNTTLIDNGQWRGWRKIFELTIKKQSDDSLS